MSVIAGVTWDKVTTELLGSLSELYRCYGPLQVHPLHASLAGEATMARLLRLPVVFEDYMVVGKRNEYFEEYPHFSGDDYSVLTKNEDGEIVQFPTEAGMALVQEERHPFINVFERDDESHTDQTGLYFPKANCFQSTVTQRTAIVVIVKMTMTTAQVVAHRTAKQMKITPIDQKLAQKLISLQDAYHHHSLGRSEYIEWYHALKKYDKCTSLAQAWCQLSPLGIWDDPWDDWTQLLRAAWLQAHKIAPFDEMEHGQRLWDHVRQSIVEENIKVPNTYTGSGNITN